jgi:hypothetical protein
VWLVADIKPFKKRLISLSRSLSRRKCEEINYTSISRAQDARHNGYTERDNKNLASMEKVIYFGTTLANQNFIHKEIKGRLTLGKA